MDGYKALEEKVLALLDAQDWESAFSLVKNGDMKGDGNATAILAEFYLYGLGIPEDTEKAVELFEKAYARGCMEAADRLGSLYIIGEKVPQDESKGTSYIMKAAEMGNPFSMGKLADMYLNGERLNKDYMKALEWGLKAAKLGDKNGMEVVAVIYDDGLGVYRDPAQASYWYRECLQREPENTFCLYRLAVCLSDPFEVFHIHPTQEMLEEAYSCACRGAEKGDLDCHMLVGWFYEMGYVVRQDYDMAYKYFKIAADNGHEISTEHIKRYRRNIFGNYYLAQ